MNAQEQRLEMARRLSTIAEKVGFALWQIQELEGVAMVCLAVFRTVPGSLTRAEGQNLIDEMQSKPFANIIEQLAKGGQLSPVLQARFDTLRKERNWLVHKSRADSRSAVHYDSEMSKLVSRLSIMADESLVLMEELQALALAHTRKLNISSERIAREAKRLLASWHSPKRG